MTITQHPRMKLTGLDLHKVVRDTASTEAGSYAEIAAEKAKREPQSVVEARVRDSFDRLFAPGPLTFSDDGTIGLPLVAVDVTGNTHVKAIVNPAALFGRIPAFVEAAWAEVSTRIEETYLGVTETATADEKRTRIAAINARILEGRRVRGLQAPSTRTTRLSEAMSPRRVGE